MRSTRWIVALVLSATLVGAAASRDTSQAQADELSWFAGDTCNFARFAADFVSRSHVPTDDKPSLLARAAILAHHSQAQVRLVAAWAAKGPDGLDSELQELRARSTGLREERRTLERELSVWQVEHQMASPEDIDLVYLVPVGGGC